MSLSIVKVGGSVITDGKSEGYFDSETTRRVAEEFAPHLTCSILVHGTGAVGKRPAVEEGYAGDGILPGSNPRLSIRVKRALRDLNRRFIGTLLSVGIPVLPLDVASYFDRQSQRLRADGLKRSLLDAVRGGAVPVFHGDITARADDSYSVLSSDTIVLMLALALRPQNVFFLTDVDGVFPEDESPEKGNAPIPVLREGVLEQVRRENSDEKDVSGGMRAKVRIALTVARYADNCIIANGTRPGVAGKLMAGQEVRCTRVEAPG